MQPRHPGPWAFAWRIIHCATGLCEEIRPFEVDRDQAIETFFGGVEQIGPHIGRYAGVVHQNVEAAEFTLNIFEHFGASVTVGDIGAEI